MRVATVDIGTNTVILLVAELGPDGLVRAVHQEAQITRLGQGVDRTRRLHPDAVARTTAVLRAYAAAAKAHGAERFDVVGTSAMRDAEGAEEVHRAVEEGFRMRARILSGDEEAVTTFAGAISGLSVEDGPTAVYDIGGGSTEIAVGRKVQSGALHGVELAYRKSFDVGSVRMTERHVQGDPPTEASLDAVRGALRETFAALPQLAFRGPPVGVAGTMTTLAAVHMGLATYDGNRVHGARISALEIRAVVERLARMPLAERGRVPGLDAKRADVIVAGGLVAEAVLEALGAAEAIVSDRGVRWGLAEALLRETAGP
jgi:exopolyphosphatase/guanosine-5'-triphosphate,3'-diphosphate pyrophosphatase